MRKQPSVGLVLGLAVVSVLGVARPAGATEDRKNYPGAACFSTSSTWGNVTHDTSVGYAGYGSGSPLAFCPALADCGSAYSTGHWATVSAGSGYYMRCKLCRRDEYSGAGSCGSYVNSYYNDGAAEVLAITAGYTASLTYSATWFVCDFTYCQNYQCKVFAYGIDENC